MITKKRNQQKGKGKTVISFKSALWKLHWSAIKNTPWGRTWLVWKQPLARSVIGNPFPTDLRACCFICTSPWQWSIPKSNWLILNARDLISIQVGKYKPKKPRTHQKKEEDRKKILLKTKLENNEMQRKMPHWQFGALVDSTWFTGRSSWTPLPNHAHLTVFVPEPFALQICLRKAR